jgi:lipoprotein NlpI
MSLILDALKKSETDRAGTIIPTPQLSSFEQDSQPAKSSRLIVYIATVGIAVFGGIAGYGFLNYRSDPVPPPSIAEPAPAPVEEPAEVIAEPVPEPAEDVVPEPVSVTHEPAAPEATDTPSLVPEEIIVEDPAVEEEPTPIESAPIEPMTVELTAEGDWETAVEQPAPDPVKIEPVFAASLPPTKPLVPAPPAINPIVNQPPSGSMSPVDSGWMHLSNQDYAAAIASFKLASARNADSPDAHYGMGWAYEKSNRIDLAITSYTKAMELDPTHANAMISRGFLRYYENEFEVAGDDFRHIIDSEKGELHDYALLWTYLSIARASGNTAHAHGQLINSESHTAWPGVLFSYYMGKKSRDQVVAAINEASGTERQKRECVGYFFVGQLRLLVGDTAGARTAFQKTLATGMTKYRQFAAAATELERLSGQ